MDLLVFDNDGTLYDDKPPEQEFLKVLFDYVRKLSGRPVEDVPEELNTLKAKYATKSPIVALAREFGLPIEEIIANTYLKIEPSKCNVTIDCSLKDTLRRLPEDKVVLTNNVAAYARKVLSHLGIAECFSDVIGMQELGFILKPDPRAFITVERLFPGFDRYILIDDKNENLQSATHCGWEVILCSKYRKSAPTEKQYREIKSISELIGR